MRVWHLLLLLVVFAILVSFYGHSILLGAGTFVGLIIAYVFMRVMDSLFG